MRALAIAAPAKVNLFLGVGRPRADGYHAVTTVVQALELADAVRLTPSDALTLTCDMNLGISPEDNLAYRAAQLFARVYDVDVLVDIELTKLIPPGAGLAGGSADAAAVLAGLAYWADLPLDDPGLLEVARSLGADCAFALVGGAALMGGRGDELVRRLPSIEAHVALLMPPSRVATADAYRAFDAAPLPIGEDRPVIDALLSGDIRKLSAGIANNMTGVSSGLVPDISNALELLCARKGVLGAMMAGSGSAVFALCEDAASAQAISDASWPEGWWSVATSTRTSGVIVVDEEECS